MNTSALVIALRNVIDSGNAVGDIESVRAYIGLYSPTKGYIHKYLSESDLLRNVYKQLPDLEFKEFRNPYYLFKDFFFDKLKNRWGVTINDYFANPIDCYPARSKYILETQKQIWKIEALFKDLLEKISEDVSI
jgi:hypothetical protein